MNFAERLRGLIAEATPGRVVMIPAGNRPEIVSVTGPNAAVMGPLVARIESCKPVHDAALIVALVNRAEQIAALVEAAQAIVDGLTYSANPASDDLILPGRKFNALAEALDALNKEERQ